MKRTRYSTQKASIKSSSTERSMQKTTSVTSYVFKAPAPHKMAALIIIVSLVFGFLVNFNFNRLSFSLSTQGIFENSIIFGLIMIGLPALLSGLISTPLAHLLGGTFYYRRSFLLAFISAMIIFVIVFLGKILSIFYTFDMLIIIIFAYALIISVRHSVLLATSNHKHLNTLPASINQTLFGFIFICISPVGLGSCSTNLILYMICFSIIFLVTTAAWIWILKRPFKRNFNADGLLLMKRSLTQFTSDIDSDKTLEHEFFSKLGQKANVRLGVVCIKDKVEKAGLRADAGTSHSTAPLKTLILVPSIHPGPFGILGGGDLPEKLKKYLKNVTNNIMVFHGPATHDQDPVLSQECVKVARAAQKLVEGTKYSDDVSAFHRIKLEVGAKTKTSAGPDSSHLNVCSQRLGNGNVYIHTSAPESTDDIDYPTGEAVVAKAEHETNLKALFIDAHNCLEPGTGTVNFGTDKANNILKLVGKLNKQSETSQLYTISTGYASFNKFKLSDGLGPQGVQVLVVKCKPRDDLPDKGEQPKQLETNAYILLDGNNIVPGLREQLIIAIGDLVDKAEVFTTDNHVVNATMGGYNPVGLKLSHDRLTAKVCQLVKSALAKCRPSEVGMNSGVVKNIRIFGQDTIMRLSTTINSTISIMRSSLLVCQALALSACWVVALVI